MQLVGEFGGLFGVLGSWVGFAWLAGFFSPACLKISFRKLIFFVLHQNLNYPFWSFSNRHSVPMLVSEFRTQARFEGNPAHPHFCALACCTKQPTSTLMGFLAGEIKFKACSRNASNAFQKARSTQPVRPD